MRSTWLTALMKHNYYSGVLIREEDVVVLPALGAEGVDLMVVDPVAHSQRCVHNRFGLENQYKHTTPMVAASYDLNDPLRQALR